MNLTTRSVNRPCSKIHSFLSREEIAVEGRFFKAHVDGDCIFAIIKFWSLVSVAITERMLSQSCVVGTLLIQIRVFDCTFRWEILVKTMANLALSSYASSSFNASKRLI